MFRNLDYRTIRALRICVVFTASILIEQQLKIPRGAWTAFTVMMIYVGFDTGAAIQRIFHRFLGVVLGLFIAYILWFVGHVNYRTLFLMIPCCIFFAYYFLGKSYIYPTVFTVILTVIGPDYFGSPGYYVPWFFSDYLICTILAVVICIAFEYFIFKKMNMTRKFYIDLQKNMITCVETLLATTKKSPISKSAYIQATVILNKKIIELNTFVSNTKNDYHNKDDLITELDEFTQHMNLAYQNIRRMFILPKEQHFSLLTDTHHCIQKLHQLIKTEKMEFETGESHV